MYTGYYFSEMCKTYNAKKNLLKKYERILETEPFPNEYQLIAEQTIIKQTIAVLEEHIGWVEEMFRLLEKYYGKDVRNTVYAVFVEQRKPKSSQELAKINKYKMSLPYLRLKSGEILEYKGKEVEFVSFTKNNKSANTLSINFVEIETQEKISVSLLTYMFENSNEKEEQ